MNKYIGSKCTCGAVNKITGTKYPWVDWSTDSTGVVRVRTEKSTPYSMKSMNLKPVKDPDCPTHGTKAPKECNCGFNEGKAIVYDKNAWCPEHGQATAAPQKKTPPSKAPLRERVVQLLLGYKEALLLNQRDDTEGTYEEGTFFEEAFEPLFKSHSDSQVREALERVKSSIGDLAVPKGSPAYVLAYEFLEAIDQELKKVEEHHE